MVQQWDISPGDAPNNVTGLNILTLTPKGKASDAVHQRALYSSDSEERSPLV